MSKIRKTVILVLLTVVLGTSPAAFGQGGDLDVVVSYEAPLWKITGNYSGPVDSTLADLRFVNTYADAESLGDRISQVRAFDTAGNTVELSGSDKGVYGVRVPYSRFEYLIDISTPSPLIAAPHISWARNDLALFKLLDLLPELRAEGIEVTFVLPRGWSIFTSEKRLSDGVFQISDPGNAVFLAGSGVRTTSRKIGGAEFLFAIAGDWQFEDSELPEMTVEIIAEYEKIFGSVPEKRFQVNLLPFPRAIGNDRWRAQTQSGTVTIVSSPSTYRNLATQRLHEQLRHELFHLWIPEGIKLEGDYAWFYEGFARYQSLKTGVWVGRIRFEDFLNSMSEAINISASDRSGLPLSGLSRSIWVSGPGIVSAQGMSIAFLCDLKLLAGSGGKRSSQDILTNLYAGRRNGVPENAMEAIEAELSRFAELRGVLESHINGTEPIEWTAALRPFGMIDEKRNGRTILSVAPGPKGKSKALLNKLGYTRWKKYTPRS